MIFDSNTCWGYVYDSTQALMSKSHANTLKYCVSRNVYDKIFSQIWLKQTFRFLLSRLSKAKPTTKLTIVPQTTIIGTLSSM